LRIGWSNLKAYNRGVMKYHTPDINSITKDGVLFTDHSAQPS
jgi:arylsulfatase